MNAPHRHPTSFLPIERVVLDTSLSMADARALGLDARAYEGEAEWMRITRTLHPQVGPIIKTEGVNGEVEYVGAIALRTLRAEIDDALRLAGEAL